MTRKLSIALAAASSLTACHQQPATPATPEASAPDQEATTTNFTTRSVTSSVPEAATRSVPVVTEVLNSLEPQRLELAEWKTAELNGELGCGFRRRGDNGPLLFAASDVDRAATSDAAIKLDGKVFKLTTESKGGFNALSVGARFSGPDGLAANVVRSGERIGETPQIAEESPLYPAQLVVSQAGRELSIDGFWECGP